jgi:glycosyltransferase involved in cell wall biosynthesis
MVPGRFANALDPRGFWAMSRAVRAFQPEALFASTGKEYWPVLLAGLRHATPVLFFRHVFARLHPWTRWAVARRGRYMLAVSHALRTELVLQGLPLAHSAVSYNPIDVEFFRPDLEQREQMRASCGAAAHEVLVGYVGGVERSKGPGHLVRVFNRTMSLRPDIRALWVVPKERHAEIIREVSVEHRPRHHLLDWQDDLVPTYSAMDVLAVPSLRPETFGRVAIEAQACGVPVLASRLGGLAEALQDGITGYLLPPGDVEAWSEAVLDLAARPDRRRTLGVAGQAWVSSRFSLEQVAGELGRLLDASVESERRAPGPLGLGSTFSARP